MFLEMNYYAVLATATIVTVANARAILNPDTILDTAERVVEGPLRLAKAMQYVITQNVSAGDSGIDVVALIHGAPQFPMPNLQGGLETRLRSDGNKWTATTAITAQSIARSREYK